MRESCRQKGWQEATALTSLWLFLGDLPCSVQRKSEPRESRAPPHPRIPADRCTERPGSGVWSGSAAATQKLPEEDQVGGGWAWKERMPGKCVWGQWSSWLVTERPGRVGWAGPDGRPVIWSPSCSNPLLCALPSVFSVAMAAGLGVMAVEQGR